MRTITRAAIGAALTASLLAGGLGTADPAGASIPSDGCDSGIQVFENTTQGVHVKLYTLSPAPNAFHVCVRVEDAAGTGYGGALVVTTGTPDVDVDGLAPPFRDGQSEACTAAVPNQVPTQHPISAGGIAGQGYLIDAALTGTTASVCLQVGGLVSERIVMPLALPDVLVDPGIAVEFNPDPGT